MEDSVRLGLLAALFAFLTAASYGDLARGRVADAVSLPAIAVGLVGGALLGGAAGFLIQVEGLLLAAALFAVPYLLKAVNGADLRAAVAVGALTGPHFAARALLLSTLVGAALGLIILVWRGRGPRVPFGLALAVGTVWTFAWCLLSLGDGVILMERGWW